MAFTQTQLDALEAAIATGTKRYTHEGRTVEYHSLAEMIRVRKLMRDELGLTSDETDRYSTATHSR